MKFSSVLVVVSFLAQQAFVASARPSVDTSAPARLRSRHNRRFDGQKGFGGFDGRNAGNHQNHQQGQNGDGSAKTTTSAASKSTSAKGGFGKNGGKSSNTSGEADSTTTASAAATDSAASTDASTTTTSSSASVTAASSSNSTGSSDDDGGLQSSLQLDPALIGSNLAENGLAGGEPGQVASLTSTNNFINFCASVNQPITNGEQVTGGSCNPVPMGSIPANTAQPSCKFTNPKNGDTIPANTNFTITLAVSNLDTGNFVNADTNYFAAPQQLNDQGIIIAHSHVVVESLPSLDSTTVTNPTVFAFFKGLNDAAVDGILSAEVAGGLPAGTYKVSSINTAANHQPVLGPVAQHGSFDDVSYFTVQ